MKASRLPLDWFACGLMFLLCICWGFQQVAIKLVLDDVPSILQLAIRSGGAALVLGALVLWREGRNAFNDGTLLPGISVGALFALEFLFIGQGLNHTSASHLSVFLYTAPMFAALGLHLMLPEERLSPLQWAGVLVAFGGIALAFLGQSTDAPGSMLLGDAFGVLAALAWGATTLVIRGSSLSDASAVKTLFYQLFGAALLLFAVAFATDQTQMILTQDALLSLGFQVVVIALVSYLAWFWLLRKYLASRLSVLSFMTPLFGVAFGVLVLGESIEPSFAIGAALVLAGILLVSGTELLRERLARRAVVASEA
ncbi:DMT family transporter [Metapseudomonas boanensis]|uniref:DMT family transporter n=1 Tax=Metapseudomonas boanensis TaxID=2822138 RepID=A0ABS5XFS5_9GAMM|nr:DMT family transporter [Pseudomonas boanensis]MBT8766543.1 DMT family transporter [Pseudomonas boanensis]